MRRCVAMAMRRRNDGIRASMSSLPYSIRRNRSKKPAVSSWIRRKTTATAEPPNIFEKEKDMGKLQRKVRDFYAKGLFEDAMNSAKDAEIMALDIYGNEHPVYASCVNNRGIVYKSLGVYEDAVECFEKAAGVYYHSVGKEHRSTATTFHNLAMCYKAIADGETGMKRLETLHQANVTFEDALEACTASLGPDHPTTALAASGLAAVIRDLAPSVETTVEEDKNLDKIERREKDLSRAEGLLTNAMSSLETSERTSDSLAMATVVNNLAYHYKFSGDDSRYKDAVTLYYRAIDIRSRKLSSCHPDTVAARSNLAELYLSMGKERESQDIQASIIRDLKDSGVTVVEEGP